MSCLLLLFGLKPALAQDVWTLDTTTTPGTAHLDIAVLSTLAPGQTFDLRVDADAVYPIRLDSMITDANGDRAWYGSIADTGLDYSLVVTVGHETAHLILTSPSGIFQLFGLADGDGSYAGAFNRLDHVRDTVAVSDVVDLPAVEAAGDILTASGLVIDQRVSTKAAPVGSELTFELDFSNRASVTLADQYVDIFFVLENTTRKTLPAACQVLETTDTPPLPVLRCDLGDIAAGAKKHLAFTVATTDSSYPLVQSAAVVDGVRDDVFVELYRDVLTDTDEDGISDFNESLIGLDPLDGLDAVSEPVATIDVLVAYTPELDDLYRGEVDTRINQLFNVANKIFADSLTGIRLRPVGIHTVSYTAQDSLVTDLSTLTTRSHGAFADIDRLRKLYGGDLVVLFRSGEQDGLCGLANLGGLNTRGDLAGAYQQGFAFSVINLDCMDDSVLAHEVGHNLGLVHSRREDPQGGTLEASAGYGVDTRFVTVMAFPDDFDVVNRLYRFSDPRRYCGPYECGVEAGDGDQGADAVSTLKLVKHQVAAYYASQEQRIDSLPAVSSQAGAVDAILGVGAYAAGGDDFARYFSVNDKLTFRLKVSPLARQVGEDFVAHLVVATADGHYYQATVDGDLVPWDRSPSSLVPATAPRRFQDRELLDILDDLDVKSSGLSGQLGVFVAYRMVDTGELVFSGKPYILTITD